MALLALLVVLPIRSGLPAAEAVAVEVVALPAVLEADDRWGINHVDPAAPPWMARDAGARWNRWEVRWDAIEPIRGRYDWRATDAAVSASVSAGLQVNGILISTPEWAADPANHGLPSGLFRPWNDPRNLWARFVRDAVSRYRGQVRAWEVWNEPDDAAVFWPGTVADYYQLLKVSYQAIKSVDPSALVLIGGLAHWPNPGFLDELLRLMMADGTARARGYYFDVLALHTYSRPSDVRDRVIQSRQKLEATVGPKPIWVNEANVPAWDESPMHDYRPYPWSATVREQASYVIQAFAYAVVSGASKLFIYRWQDTEWPEAFGLLRNDGSLRPAYVAYQVASRYFSYVPGGQVARHRNVEQIVMRRGQERISVVWNRSPARTSARLGAAALDAAVVDQTGATSTVRARAGQYELSLEAASANTGVDATDYLAGGPPLIILERLSPTAQTIEETSALIGYAGHWPALRAGEASGQAVWRNASPGYGVSVGFEGPSVTWLTARGPDRGRARVEVDGVLQAEIDLYSPEEVWQVPHTFGPFGPGPHRLTISILPQRPSESSGTVVDIDGFTAEALHPAPPPPTPTPTPTATPTITPSPTVTRTATMTPTAVASPTPTVSPAVTVPPAPVSPTPDPGPAGAIIIERDGDAGAE